MRRAPKNTSEHPSEILVKVGAGGFPPIKGIGIARACIVYDGVTGRPYRNEVSLFVIRLIRVAPRIAYPVPERSIVRGRVF